MTNTFSKMEDASMHFEIKEGLVNCKMIKVSRSDAADNVCKEELLTFTNNLPKETLFWPLKEVVVMQERVIFSWVGHYCPPNWNHPNTGLYALSMHLRNTATVGPWRQTVNNFLSERSRDGSLTIQIWFPTSQYSVEVKTFEFSFTPAWLYCQYLSRTVQYSTAQYSTVLYSVL